MTSVLTCHAIQTPLNKCSVVSVSNLLRAAATYYGLKTSLLSWRHSDLEIQEAPLLTCQEIMSTTNNTKMTKFEIKSHQFLSWNEIHDKMDFSCELPFHREHLTCHENKQNFPLNGSPSHSWVNQRYAGGSSYYLVVLVAPFLCKSQARTGLPTKRGILLQQCSRPRPGPFPSLYTWSSTLWLYPFHWFRGDRLMCPRGTSVPWLRSAGLSPTSEDGGMFSDRSPGFAWQWCWQEQLLGRLLLPPTPAVVCSPQDRPSHYINSTAQVNAHGKRFQAGKTQSLFIQVVMVLNTDETQPH